MRIFYNFAVLIAVVLAFFSCDNEDMSSVEIEKDARMMPIIPDIQYYTNNIDRFHYLQSILKFCNEEANVDICIQTGDVTNNNHPDQWKNAYEQFFSRVNKEIPMVYCLGNHDYGANGGSGTRASEIPEIMRPESDIQMEGSRYDNYVRFVQLGGKQHAILVLEFAPRNEVLEWASQILQEHHDTPFIILTHAFLNNHGKLFDYRDSNCDNEYSQKSYSMGGDYLNDSREIFEKIVYANTNAKMVICGHCLHKDYITAEYVLNSIGKEIPCIMVNYQHGADGGSGYIGVLAYKENNFTLYSYSTTEMRYKRAYTSFTIDY